MAISAALLALPLTTFAQVPFSSTQAPGMNPFNRGANLPQPTPAPRQQTAPANPNGLMPYGGQTGAYSMAPAATGQIDADHKLGPRDALSYRVAEDRDDKVYQLVVTDSGEVELPLGGRVKAAGKTTQQLTADVKSKLESEYYKPGHATVFLGLTYAAPNASKGKVYFTGEVASHGAIDLPTDGQLTLYQAILQLGGFTEQANLKGVFIYRKGGPKDGIRVDCKAISNGDTTNDVVLQPGDTIKVKRKMFDFQY